MSHAAVSLVRATLVRLGAALAATALASCGSASMSPSPDGGAPGALTAMEFCAQERLQTAAFSARCFGGTAEDWKAYRDGYTPCSRFDELIAAGTVKYHPELAADCLAAQSADRACSTPENFCFMKTFEGLIPANAPCHNDYECPPNGACWAPNEFALNLCVQSVCVLVGDKPGDACTEIPLCYPGIVTCLGGTCVPYGALGDACGLSSEPACGPGLRCDLVSQSCMPLAVGSACGSDLDCVGTEYCDNGDCRPRIAVGSSCNGAPTSCVGWAACNRQTFLCEAGGHPGQPCGSSMGDDSLCIGSVCDFNADGTHTCVAPLPLGEACTSGTQCASGGCAANACATCPG
jgi:hypothetical protein